MGSVMSRRHAPCRGHAILDSIMMQGYVSIGMLLGLLLAGAADAAEFDTPDPLRAFVYAEYALGDDYFINGVQDTFLFRCNLAQDLESFEGVAFSEISIWGNRTGPWEVSKKQPNGRYAYRRTTHYPTVACLEWCRSKDYLSSGQCLWKRGWPEVR